jgi:hypothetical protein
MTDTDGIIDRCAECGALAEFRGVGPAGLSSRHVQCTECANATDYTWTQADAMVEWNKAQRAIKAIKAGV